MSESEQEQQRTVWFGPICPHGNNTVYGRCGKCFTEHQQRVASQRLAAVLHDVTVNLERTVRLLDLVTARVYGQPVVETDPVTARVDRRCECEIPQGGTSYCYRCHAPARDDQLLTVRDIPPAEPR